MNKVGDQRAVVVIGASSGIGNATAFQLDQMGFQVFASVRNQKDADLLRAQTSKRLTPILLDVTDQESITSARDEVGRKVGKAGLWGLVNCAGVSFRAPLEFTTMDEMRELFEVNVFGILAVTQAFLPLLRMTRGRIINVGTISAFVLTPFSGSYCASKICMKGITDILRLELAPQGVGVSLIVYGGVKTPLWNKVQIRSEWISRAFPSEYQFLYGENQRRAFKHQLRTIEAGRSPNEAALAIVKALTIHRPKRTYIVGSDTQLYYLLGKLLQGGLRDWLMYRILGLKL